MNELVDTPVHDAIDARIAAALDRVTARASVSGPTATALAEAAGRAAVGGKRFRPALVAAAYRAWGGTPGGEAAMYDVAAAFELLHASFVVHDDVLDHDLVRRGVPNVAGEFTARGADAGLGPDAAEELGTAAAILAGDLLLHEAERTAALADVSPDVRRKLLEVFDEAVLVSAFGELADVEHTLAADMPHPDRLMQAAHDKTAEYSFAAPLAAGALLAGADEAQVETVRGCGRSLGLAFQLVDDLIGAFGTRAQAGRDAGVDLREAKRTPLIAIARQTPDWARIEGTLAIAHTGPIAVRAAQRALDRAGARARLVGVIMQTLAEARASADGLPDPARALVHAVADRVESRIP
ncbi:polyprenyl synthetase family protein [Microbacterium sp. GXF7504]